MNNKSITIILGVLLVLALFGGGYFAKQSTALEGNNKMLMEEISALETTRTDLLGEIETLQTNYDELMEDATATEGLYKEASEMVNKQKSQIKQLKAGFSTEVAGMKSEIEQLQTIKNDLGSLLEQLKAENMQLKGANAQLTGERNASNEQNKKLAFEIAELRQVNLKMKKELSKLVAENSRAANFRVDIKKNNDKITSSSRRAKDIVISFNLKNIPADKAKEDRLYLVITDAKGTPVKATNPVTTTIRPNTGEKSFPIIAQQTLRTELQNGGRLQFDYPLDTKLAKGYYRASVYTDWGLLGSAEFQLK